jgi:hypothetical protein
VTFSITANQRDVLYDEILDRLGAIDDIRFAIEQEDWEATSRLGAAFSDDLRIVTQDLGWGPRRRGGPVELTSPPDVLRRALNRWRDALLGLDTAEEGERDALREEQERNHLLAEACRSVLAELDAAEDHRPAP